MVLSSASASNLQAVEKGLRRTKGHLRLVDFRIVVDRVDYCFHEEPALCFVTAANGGPIACTNCTSLSVLAISAAARAFGASDAFGDFTHGCFEAGSAALLRVFHDDS